MSAARPLRLFRSILRAHRDCLPPELRALGDAYVREEFKRHKSAKAKFLVPFFTEWERYLASLQRPTVTAAGVRVGDDLSPDVVAALTPEQRTQLQQLELEAKTALRHQLLTGKDDP